MPVQTVAQALREADAALADASVTPRFDAELLMARALGMSRSDMVLRAMDAPVPSGFDALLARRRRHEPMGYILGEEPFFGLTFKVGPDVLIPRPDSEVLVERALLRRTGARSVLDCGTGSGALLLAVLFHLTDAQGTGIDRSSAALAVARENALALGLAGRARMVLADWEREEWADGLGGPFDLILANPPYVETTSRLEPSVRDYEPADALFAGPEGLDAYRVLIPQIPCLLAPGGMALVEIGAGQAEPVSALAQGCGLDAELVRDTSERARVLELSTI